MRTRLTALAATIAITASCAGSNAGSSWETVTPPTVADSTDEVVTTDGTLADGRYWASLSRVSGSDDLVFTVARAWFGDACTIWAAERGMDQGCMNDYAVDDVDTALVAISPDAAVSVAAQMGPGTNYAITVETLDGLVAGTAVSPIAAYQWTGFPFVVTVADGVVTDADQLWVP